MHISVLLFLYSFLVCTVSNLLYINFTIAPIFPTASNMAFCFADCAFNFTNTEFTIEAIYCFTLASYSFNVSKTPCPISCDSSPAFSTFLCDEDSLLSSTYPFGTSLDCYKIEFHSSTFQVLHFILPTKNIVTPPQLHQHFWSTPLHTHLIVVLSRFLLL